LPPPEAVIALIAAATSVSEAVIERRTTYSLAASVESLKSTTANCESGTEDLTPFTIDVASVLAWAMEGPMLPVVSMAMRTSAASGLAGTATLIPTLALAPGARVTAALLTVAVALAVDARTTGVSCNSIWAMSSIGRASTDARRATKLRRFREGSALETPGT